MNVFITGASGFVGSHLVKALSADKAVKRIYALYRNEDQIAFLPKVNPVIGDLEKLPEIDLDVPIDLVIHLAGYFRNESKKLCEKVNLQGTKNTIAFCRNNGIKRILFYSTINVDLKTKGNYATTKLMAEEEVRKSGLEYMIVRPALIYEGRKGSLGKIIRYVEKLPFVPVFGDGNAKEQPIHIDEIVNLTVAMIKDFKPGTVLYAAGKEAMTFREMINIIARTMNKKAKILTIPAKPVHAVLRLFEKAGIHIGISSEQVAHMSEDLAADMNETLKLYPVELKSFEENIRRER
ncbi:NADH dehydrogenase-like protein [Thermoclostridium stercorarium subsp. stercorarium DSM 8532]|jgi:nucleoside-diphosphate-sugar epimerase|uniref:NADH dehydrogenase-like protein n=3 Tax=Thermoclostridium stercorarium TaxID=1510 RepID=L7VL29_THES1|nr:NAD-dependent epimerase/dehydratase family protein [Thermoclostridium stercorarium]AGC67161.1 NADH dehydrogenase-like protein [Thermoclostridium stercorarium subsp. stercorarium DSM 8532]AGI38238.1 nucleoside-diphosphate-sugar epimerase [Thermoclostridium stercorarium subsp. stercorarium DSM 8532]ANW97638.1 NADH dehydrogenase [Thermoclostridium stercorarium subsp. thermolacticum DSM 2910]ANX00198.1 NADH dehydrogenase [Thermoclostridium stercorarium subsp. leptospartum DSM 9219]UZQ85757.1 NA